MRNIIIYALIFMLVVSTIGGTISSVQPSLESSEKPIHNRAYTHTILGEFTTATWCGYCKYAHEALKNIYEGGWHPFYYTSLVCDKNKKAYARGITELGATGYPTVFFDGGYRKNVGAGSTPSAQAAYNTSIGVCGSRSVADIDLSLEVTWLGAGNPGPENGSTDVSVKSGLNWTNAAIDITATVDNNEGSTYTAHLHVYVTEVVSSMEWRDTGGHLYTFPFLDYAFNKGISVGGSSTWEETVEWDGKQHNTGYGEDFGEITQDNTMIIAAVIDSSEDVDETYGLLAGNGTDPKKYDVYLGENNPPPKVSSNQSTLSYNPGTLKFNTTYYWKIVVWDKKGSKASGPIWSFTTRGNKPPNAPRDPEPEDGASDIEIDVKLSWTGDDPDGDDVTYDIYFGDGNPPPKVKGNKTKPNYTPPDPLDFDTTYYWKIIAWDEFNYSTAGPLWTFTTEENMAPYEPSDPDPEDGAIDVSIQADLSWSGGDPNSGDTVTYDLYFGTTNPPPKIVDNQTYTTYNPGTMELNGTYYWKIVAWDSQRLSASGDIWHFTTANQPPHKPSIDGTTSGKPDEEYDYTFSSVDPEDSDVYFNIDWGDGNIEEWIGPYDSGEEVTHGHTWSDKGAYTITIKAKDAFGAISPEETLEVSMPKNKAVSYNYKLLDILFERISFLVQVLRNMLRC
jgi:glutaredoxin